jgi:hypothetical protein
MYDSDGPVIFLSKPILITKNSNPKLLSNFIDERLGDMLNTFHLDESIIERTNDDGASILVKYKEINLNFIF